MDHQTYDVDNDDDDDDDFDEEEWEAAVAANAELKKKLAEHELRHREDEHLPAAPAKPKRPRPRKDQLLNESERLRIERDNMHLVRHIQELGKKREAFSVNTRYAEERHVAASAIIRRRTESKICRENRQIAHRLEQVGEGGIRSSGYGRRPQQPRGPLAKKNMEMARNRRLPRLQQPEMSF